MTVAKTGELPPQDQSVNDVVDGRVPETQVAPRLGFAVATQDDVADIPVPISPPWLQIAHGISDLCTKLGFPAGALVLAKQHVLTLPQTPDRPAGVLKCIIWGDEMYYKEYKYTPGVQPKVFKTAKEAQAAGFTTEYSPVTGMPSCPPAMTWLMLIEQPKDLLCDMFFLEIRGRKYATCFFGIDKMAFGAVKDIYFTTKRFGTAGRGIKSIEWELKTRIKPTKSGEHEAFVPQIKKSRVLPEDELQEFIAAAMELGGRAIETPAPVAQKPGDIETTATEVSKEAMPV